MITRHTESKDKYTFKTYLKDAYPVWVSQANRTRTRRAAQMAELLPTHEAGEDNDIDEPSDDEPSDEELEEEPEAPHVFKDNASGKEYSFRWSKTHAEIRQCARGKERPNESGEPFIDLLSVPEVARDSAQLKYFLLFAPVGLLTLAAEQIDERGRGKYGNQFISKGRQFDMDLMLKFFGCFHYMLLAPGLQRASYWDSDEDPLGLFAPYDLSSKSTLSLTDFNHILEFFAMPQYEAGAEFTFASSPGTCGYPSNVTTGDAFQPVRRWLDALNEVWGKAFQPGTRLCIDESMIKWLGRSRCPGWMKVGRKPDSIGHELKTLACAQSIILFRFEMQEGKALDREKEYVEQFGAATALTLRMLAPYKGEGKILIADSWFGCVKACILLLDWGIYSIMNVKTAHANFPKKLLFEKLEEKGVGQHVALQTEVTLDADGKEHLIFATAQKGPGMMNAKQRARVGWEGDAKGVPLLLVNSCSTTLDGNLRKYRSHAPDPECQGKLVITHKTVTQTQNTAMYRKDFNAVDRLNRQKTGTTAMYDVWRTIKWELRDFGETIMMILVNAENAWKYFDDRGKRLWAEQKSGTKTDAHREFLRNLTAELFHNPYAKAKAAAAAAAAPVMNSTAASRLA
mmetsp:Transcript_4278/g.7273  ORF Transcript_4278/g.7273 Transcript_4278/m.7273 type:complete len:627 (+) Transcript_4278:3056-4936(+)